MTEEQYKKCEEIYNLYIRDIWHISEGKGVLETIIYCLKLFNEKEEEYKKYEEKCKKCKEDIRNICRSSEYKGIETTIYLAKVFNKEITEEEAEEIFTNIYDKKKDINYIGVAEYVGLHRDTFWRIANYFYDGKTYGFIPNYLRDKNFKEIKKDNENNKENNK